ncbi:hypothetical protein BH23BAC2_BH23BAC2_15780 [soil metagenome]
MGYHNIPLNWGTIFSKKRPDLEIAIREAIAQKTIQKVNHPDIIAFLDRLQGLALTITLDSESDGELITLDKVLTFALPDKEQRVQLMEALRDFDGDFQKFWSEELPGKNAFQGKPELIEGLELTSQLTQLGGSYLPMVEELQKNRKVKSVTDLLKIKDEEWNTIVSKTGTPKNVPGKTVEEKTNNYRKGIQNRLNAAYPTQKVALMLEANDIPTINQNISKSLTNFLSKSKFDIANSRVLEYEQDLRQTTEEDFEQAKSNLLTLQRVYQVSPTPETMGILLSEGLTSAQAIASIPEKTFLKSYAQKLGGEELAFAVHQKAVFNAQRANMLYLDLHTSNFGAFPKVVMDEKERDTIKQMTAKIVAGQVGLIGNPNMCECEHCRSVYSASAYFVELLRFLHFSRQNEAADPMTPLQILFQRRPDLKRLPLTCENTNTLIPYIDLVNEILEYYVAYSHNEDGSVNPEPLTNYEGYDTGEVTSEELRASPQNTFLKAYENLVEAAYPFTLPYHRPLDVIRNYLKHLGTTRHEVASSLQTIFEDLQKRALEAELLECTEEEYKILTQKDFLGEEALRPVFEFYGFENTSDLKQITSVPEFLKRTGVKYTELVALVKTRFINPSQWTLSILEEIFSESGIPPVSLYEKLKQIENGTLNPDLEIGKALNSKKIKPNIFVSWVQKNFSGFQSIVTLYEPESNCNLETTSLKILQTVYEDNSTPEIEEQVWLNIIHRFIRLWRKLGWKIQELDLILYALGETDITPATISKLSQVYKINKELKLPLEQLGIFWGAIETNGDKPLYKKLFLNKSAVHLVDLFKPDHLGNYFNSGINGLLKNHIPALLASFKITDEELQAILNASEIMEGENKRTLSLEDTLSLPIVSVIYRHVVLAKALKYKVVDLCYLIRIFAATPFSLLQITDTTQVFTDIDPGKTHELITLFANVKRAGFKPITIEYIFSGTLPPESSLALKPEKIYQTIKDIRSTLDQIESTYPNTPLTPLTPDFLRNTLIMTFQPEVVDQILLMMNEKFVYSAHAAPGLTIRIPDSLSDKYTYDSESGILTCNGLMSDTESQRFLSEVENRLPENIDFLKAISQIYLSQRIALKSNVAYSTIVPGNPAAIIPEDLALKYNYQSGRLTGMGIMTETEREKLSNGHSVEFLSGLNNLFEAPAIFLSNNFSQVFEGNLSELFAKLLNRPENGSAASLDEKLLFVYQHYLPLLKRKLKEDATVQLIASLIGLSEPATSVLVKPKVEQIIDTVKEKGFSAQYFNNINFSGRPVEARTEAANQFNGNDIDVTSLPERFSVRWTTYLGAPAREDYFFVIEVSDAGDAFKVFLDDKLILEKAEGYEVLSWETEESLNLNGSGLHHLKIERITSKLSGIQLYWKTATQGLEPIPEALTYPSLSVNDFTETVRIYHRTAKFITGFNLNVKELNHLKQYSADFVTEGDDQINFESLTTSDWQRVHQIKELSKAIIQADYSLIDIFEESKKHFPLESASEAVDRIVTTIQKVTGWDKRYILFLIGYYGYNHTLENIKNAFKNEIALNRLNSVMQLIQKTGTSPELLINFASLSGDFTVLSGIAQNIQSTVQAKYEESQWLEIAGSLSDKIRDHQRNALIAYLLVQPQLQQAQVKDADSLFEYFLIDVQMGTCMDTSRMVQANNSIQLFVSRCLLNLESKLEGNPQVQVGVTPDAIATNRWEWMKNYRVWEANRKIFVYPENWLEPEWRTNKSPFFKDLESEILKNDITDRTVESAFRAYLNKMDEVARLDLCGMYEDTNTSVIHVFGRTNNTPRKYYYRTYNEHKKWSAWEKVELDIRGVEEGETGVHLIPVVWKKRLFLFWPEFQPKQRQAEVSNQAAAQLGGSVQVTPPGGRSSATVVQPDASRQTIAQTAENQTMSSLRPNEYWEIKLAFSEYLEGKWTAKKVSSQPIISHLENKRPEISRYDFRTEINPENQILTIGIHWTNTKVGQFSLSDVQTHIIANNLYGETNIPIQDQRFFLSTMYLTYSPSKFLGNFYFNLYSNHVSHLESKTRRPFFSNHENINYFVLPQDFVSERNISAQKELYPFVWQLHLNLANNGLISNDTSEATTIHYTTAQSKNPPVGHAKSAKSNMQSSITAPASFSFATKVQTNPRAAITKFLYHTFYHPFTSNFIRNLNEFGMDGLMACDTTIPSDNGNTFESNYASHNNLIIKPDDFAGKTYYKEDISFDVYAAYSIYNWELFFHAPLFIATQLSKNGKYAEAMRWFHYIFDPTTDEKPVEGMVNQRLWKVLPFRTTESTRIEEWFRELSKTGDPTKEDQIAEWRANPFNPHLVAENRHSAYMNNVVMKYVENLISWGDQLFRRDTMESINQATQLYVMANHILGPRPELIPKRGKIKAETYESLENKLDAFSNALVQMENLFPHSSKIPASSVPYSGGLTGGGPQLYFCIPANEKLLTYWDTVADRLFKIRHCMNIEGVERRLALFEPPIDPAMLVQARAQGLDLGSILGNINSPAPVYRFNYLLQKAGQFCSEVKSLGAALLSAMEKKDGEELGRMRALQETGMLNLMTAIKERQLVETQVNHQSLLKSRESTIFRRQHYLELLGIENSAIPDLQEIPDSLQLPPDTTVPLITPDVDVSLVDSDESGIKLIPRENEELNKLNQANTIRFTINSIQNSANIAYLFPDVSIYASPFGMGGTVTYGGSNVGKALTAVASGFEIAAAQLNFEAAQAAKLASLIRREQDWVLQANLAGNEIIQMDKQITAASIRVQIAQKELDNHIQQIRNSEEVEQFLKDKFTNQELYQWMKDQLYSVYKQSYNMAYEMAKKTELAFSHETGVANPGYIQYGYWDNSKEGLLSGEKLSLSLMQLEKAYMEENKRELELTKHISLALINPLALLQLKENGQCFVSLPEELFDLDYQGHFLRRIKSVGISIPCIAGPYTNVSCTLRLMKNSIRTNTILNSQGGYAHNSEEGILVDDPRFKTVNVPVKSIATSRGQNDSGMFELNFRDERYLPFEGAGAISEWQLELTTTKELRQFDFSTISDIIIHLNYTAREAGGTFKDKAIKHLKDFITVAAEQSSQPLMRMFSMKHDFPTEWHQFLHPAPTSTDHTLNITLGKKRFPFFVQNKNLSVVAIDVLAKIDLSGSRGLIFSFTNSEDEVHTSSQIEMPASPSFGGLKKATIALENEVNLDLRQIDVFKPMGIQIGYPPTTPEGEFNTSTEGLEELFLIVHYKLSI